VDVIDPGHDQPLWLTEAEETEYPAPFEMMMKSITFDKAGLRFGTEPRKAGSCQARSVCPKRWGEGCESIYIVGTGVARGWRPPLARTLHPKVVDDFRGCL
jgi:hypothetical protein